jgi:hypothetical protein
VLKAARKTIHEDAQEPAAPPGRTELQMMDADT